MIRLLTVIGHGSSIIPHFIEHYKQFVDEIHFVLYKTDEYPNLEKEFNYYIKPYDCVKVVHTLQDRVFDWDKVTLLYNMFKSKHPNDWWIIADIDEFHLYSNNDLKGLIEHCDDNGYEAVRGGFIDRIGEDGTFKNILLSGSIWEQFPLAGFFRYPMSDACPNKMCVMKGHIELTSGQHYAKILGQTTWRWQGWNHPLIAPVETYSVQVHHFKWDETVIDRIKSVANLRTDYSYSSEYEKMLISLAKNKFKVDINNKKFMFESNQTSPDFNLYNNWNKLIKKIISI